MLNPPEIKKIARATSDARLKMRYLAVYHFESGYNRTHIAEMLGVSRRSVNMWIKCYLEGGLEALKSKKSPGRPIQLSEEQLGLLAEFIEANSIKEQGGRIIAEDVREYILTTFNVNYAIRNVYRLMHSLGFSWITSRSRHPKQSLEAQEAFKKLPTGNDLEHPSKCTT